MIGLFITEAALGRVSWPVAGAVAGAVGFLGAISSLIFVTAGPSPLWAEVDSRGFRLGYPSGRVREFSWSEPKLNLRLYRYVSKAGDEPIYAMRGGFPTWNYLTREVVDAAALEAGNQGLGVESPTMPAIPLSTKYVIHPVGTRTPR